MPALLAGVVLLGLLLILARGYTTSNPKNLAKGFRLSCGILLTLATVALIMMRELPMALLAAGGAWYLLLGSPPPWHRTAPGAGASGTGQSGRRSTPPTTTMSRSEALKVLGLEEGASEADIRGAHRRLIQQTHPDKGGTNYLAAKINEAKDVLLGG
jgi:hypothetical protein